MENNQQVPQWSNVLAAMERVVWKDLSSTGKVGVRSLRTWPDLSLI